MRPRFDIWMKQVDAILVRKCGLESSDLPDQCYHMIYEDGLQPIDAVDAVLDDCQFNEDELGMDNGF